MLNFPINNQYFYTNRAVHSCVPKLIEELTSGITKPTRPSIESSPGSSPEKVSSDSKPSPSTNLSNRKLSVASISRLLLNFASFTNRAKGDIESAFIIYRRAYRIDESNPKVLAHFAHFLGEEGGDIMNSNLAHKNKPPDTPNHTKSRLSCSEAEKLFGLALKSNPSDALIAMWYAKLLKKVGKYAQVIFNIYTINYP